VRKLYSTFPGGWSGLALLLLRLTVAISSAVEGAAILNASNGASWGMPLLLMACGACVGVGLFTPIAASLLVLANAAEVWQSPHAARQAELQLLAVALSLAVLGPGTFSADSRLFGRREIVIPPGSSASRF